MPRYLGGPTLKDKFTCKRQRGEDTDTQKAETGLLATRSPQLEETERTRSPLTP